MELDFSDWFLDKFLKQTHIENSNSWFSAFLHKYDVFHNIAHLYFKDALQYVQSKFPVKNEVIQK